MKGSTFTYETAGGPRFGYLIELGRGDDGRRRQVRKRGFPDAAAAEAAMQADLTDRRRGVHVDPSRRPLAAFLDDWLEATAPGRAPHTTVGYAVACKRLAAELGPVPLADLDGLRVQKAANRLAARYAPSTARLTLSVLRIALNQAVRWRMIPANPAAGARIAAPPSAPKPAWTAGQCRAFLADAEARADPDAALWRLLLDGQLRQGEAIALRWRDLDLDGPRPRARIGRTLTKDAAGRWTVHETTKGKRPRSVVLDAGTARALVAERDRQRFALGPHWSPDRLCFPAADGRTRQPSVVQHRFRAAAARLGLPPLTLHGLRRSGATLMVLSGVPVKVVSERLGHKGFDVTDVYLTVPEDADAAAAAALGALLADPQPPQTPHTLADEPAPERPAGDAPRDAPEEEPRNRAAN